MKVGLLVVALLLISASFVAFLWEGSAVGDTRAPRAIVTGHVRGDLSGLPWAGTVATLGSERMILGADGAFSFGMMPGRYHLKVCCSQRFQAIDRDVVVEKSNIVLDLQPNPLMEIKGSFKVQGGKRLPHGFLVWASLEGTNAVDRSAIAEDGTFTFHLLEGNWEIHIDNLPREYKIASITQGDEKVRERKFTVGKESVSLPLQIALQ